MAKSKNVVSLRDDIFYLGRSLPAVGGADWAGKKGGWDIIAKLEIVSLYRIVLT